MFGCIGDYVTSRFQHCVSNLVGYIKANPRDFYHYINGQKKDTQGIPPLKGQVPMPPGIGLATCWGCKWVELLYSYCLIDNTINPKVQGYWNTLQ